MHSEAANNLTWLDAAVIATYFVCILFVGLWSSRKSRGGSASGYFLASRNMGWIPVGASLFASNIGAVHFVGLAGSGAASGIAVAGFELIGPLGFVFLGWMFVPVYLSSRVYTMPEYLQKRFGGQRIRVYLSFLSLLLTVTTKIAADLFAGALFIQMALNRTSPEWLYIGILILLAIASLFTILGGLTAVIWTDLIQTILMIIGSFVLMVIALNEVGGYQEMIDRYPYTHVGNSTCGAPRADYMHIFRSAYPGESDLPWPGMIFGLFINGTWYFCTDQVIVQRTLASKNISHAKGGCLLASYLKILPLGLMVFPGMAARVLYPDIIGCSDPVTCQQICGIAAGCSNTAYIQLVLRLLPSGLRGVMFAVMLSALMSSLTSIFNSASTIFTFDLWTRVRKNPSELELIVVGRIFVAFLALIAILWIPLIQNSPNSKLFDYIQSIIGFLASPICVVYVLALFWPRANERGAFTGLMCGLVFGLFRFALELSFPAPICGSNTIDDRPAFIIGFVDNIHYLHFTILQFLFVGTITIITSLMTEPIPERCLYRLTFASRHSLQQRVHVDRKDLLEQQQHDLSSRKPSNQMEMRGPSSPVQPTAPPQRSTGFFSSLCASDAQEQDESMDERKAGNIVDDNNFLVEKPPWKTFVDVNAVVCLTVTAFVIGFYA